MPNILPDRQKGYNDLIGYIDTRSKDIDTATIYSRDGYTLPFNMIRRRYCKGQIQEINEPVILSGQRFRNLFYYTNDSRSL